MRSGSVPVGIVEDAGPAASTMQPDLVFVDIRADAPSAASGPSSGFGRGIAALAIFAIAETTDPDLILQSMRAGANEFFMWPRARGAVSRRGPAHGGAAGNLQARRNPAVPDLVFFGAKGGAGTTTVGGELRGRAARG